MDPPQLRFSYYPGFSTGDMIILQWTHHADGWNFFTSSDLQPGSWTPAPCIIVNEAASNTAAMIHAVTNRAGFYRLGK